MNATITLPFDERLEELFAAEDHTLDRSSYTIKKEDDHTVFTITADDATALRTHMNSILKLLALWEQNQ